MKIDRLPHIQDGILLIPHDIDSRLFGELLQFFFKVEHGGAPFVTFVSIMPFAACQNICRTAAYGCKLQRLTAYIAKGQSFPGGSGNKLPRCRHSNTARIFASGVIRRFPGIGRCRRRFPPRSYPDIPRMP